MQQLMRYDLPAGYLSGDPALDLKSSRVGTYFLTGVVLRYKI